MLLTEKHTKLLEESFAGFEHKGMSVEDLKEWYEIGGAEVAADDMDAVSKMAQLQEKFLAESNVSANIANFTPKIQPLLRRIAPKLMAFDLAGVQPVSTPTSDIFMVKAQYSGTATVSADKDTSIILTATQGSVAQAVAIGDTITADNGAVGSVVYVEADYSKMIVNVTSGTFVNGGLFDVGASYTADTNDITITGVYSNEAAFKKILPGYSGPFSTAAGEVLGSEMREIRVNIVKQGITVKTRKLKASLTLELIKDMSAMHGASADKEIMYFLELEITNDQNLEIINKYKEIATLESNFAVATLTTSGGRHAQEMYSGLWDRILKDSRNMSARNQRGAGNKLVATAGVISALESLGKFTGMNLPTTVKPGANHSENFVGTLVNGMDVYQDWFAGSEEYYMVIYKGQGAFDSGLIFSPYQPLEFLEATDQNTFQPILGIFTRYALTLNEISSDSGTASEYATMRNVDFVNTPLNDA